ncbi:MAG: exonuclease domain-containing protein [Lachnospiraceae bacterium]|nr:exonuclease domain-containing protein [Lachnospiraceae bacterium]
MNYIILDLEWNQGAAEKTEEKLPFEIIEIGAIKLNDRREKTDEFNELIKPQVYHEMNYITRKLIHLQMEQLEEGKTFPDVMRAFQNWWGDDYIFCTWGSMDLVELQRNIRYYQMEPISDRPFRFLDIQKLFSIAFEDRKSRRSLEYAIDFLNIEKDIPFHRALSDAYYTAKILALLDENVLENYSFDIFHIPVSKKEEIHAIFDKVPQESYAKYISRGFENKIKAMNDKNIISTRCYLCHKNLKKRIRWFTPNGKHYYCVSYCDIHGHMKSKIRIRKSENNLVYIIKTEKFVSEEDVENIYKKQEQARQHRKEKRAARNRNHRS